jgi:DNA mismatch endonuclease (patch repair protein)
MSVDPVRRRTMQAVKSVNTTPEIQVRKLLASEGFRFRLHRKDLPGVPDVVLPGRKKVIFVHGCFWHSHSCTRGKRTPKENSGYWIDKRKKNVRRDRLVLRSLKQLGWETTVVWECELKKVEEVRIRLLNFLGRVGRVAHI